MMSAGLPEFQEHTSIGPNPSALPTANAPESAAQRVRILFDLAFDETKSTAPFTIVDTSFNRLSLELNLGTRTTQVLDEFSRRLDDAGQTHDETHVNVVKTATAATLTLSAGFAAWTLRSGALLASLFASSPLWRQFDPLPILGNDEDEDREVEAHGEDEDLFGEESLESRRIP